MKCAHSIAALAIWLSSIAFTSIAFADSRYDVVVSEATYAQPAWREVVDALVAKHAANVVRYSHDVREAGWSLLIDQPDAVCFVATPEEAGREFVVSIHRMMRRLDDDPFTDAPWGIITGYEPADALRIAKQAEPLRITRAVSAAGEGFMGPVQEGFASSESSGNQFWVRSKGATTRVAIEPDATESLVKALNESQPQAFFTSGHASEHNWQIGYNFPGGQFRHENGQLFGLDTKQRRFDINSSNPKIFLPMGNCLIGRIPQRDCMATAWMHSGGVDQLAGYTAVTFFGNMGWGTREYLEDQGHSFAESFYFAEQALIAQLNREFPLQAPIEALAYDEKSIDFIAQRFGLTEQSLGLLWDRDVVTFYGDPAWQATMPANPFWQTSVKQDEKQTTITLRATRAGTWPGKPIALRLPQRIDAPAAGESNVTVADDFVLLPMSGAAVVGFAKTITIDAPLARRDNSIATKQFERAKFLLAGFPLDDQAATLSALFEAGSNRGELLRALDKTPEPHRAATAFLIANMPHADASTLLADTLVDDVELAYQAKAQAKWGETLSQEMFFNNVLPYACANEARDNSRAQMIKQFAPVAWNCDSPGEAAKLLNETIYKALHVEYNATKRPQPCQSPQESIQAGYASCTGLSILLVDACRAAGIPARLVGIPEWNDHKGDANGNHGGNHTWVEIYDNGWHHLGASEPSELDKTWFTEKCGGAGVDANQWQHKLYAASFKRTNLTFPLVWAPEIDSVFAEDVTATYAKKN